MNVTETNTPSNKESNTNPNSNYSSSNNSNNNENSNSSSNNNEMRLKSTFGDKLEESLILEILQSNNNDYDITFSMLSDLCVAMSPTTTTTATTTAATTTEPFLYWNHPAFAHVRLYVCLFLSLRDIAACTAVCKDWKAFFEQDELWRVLYMRQWHVDNSNVKYEQEPARRTDDYDEHEEEYTSNNSINTYQNNNSVHSRLYQHDGSANHSKPVEISWKQRHYLEHRMFTERR